jgi:hypothetical protein
LIATNTSAAVNFYPVFVSAVGNSQVVYADSNNFRFVPNTGTLTTIVISSTGNVVGGNIRTGGAVSATGNILTGSAVSATGNILTGSAVSATGNITGNYIFGNGASLTGINVSAGNSIQNGNSNVLVGSSGGNISINVAGISPVALFTPAGESVTGIISASGNVTGGNLTTGGNITGAYLLGNGSQLTGIGRSLTVGTRSVPFVIPLTANGNFTVGTRSSGNVVITVTT